MLGTPEQPIMDSRGIEFTALIKQFGQAGEKTGWIHIIVPSNLAEQLMPSHKKSFRVKGSLDSYTIEQVAILPMGDGDFVLPINASMRKELKKGKGATVRVKLQVDNRPIRPPDEFIECLKDDPDATTFFNSLPKGHQNYFGKWIDSAKTEQTRTSRIALALNALSRKWRFPEMMRNLKKNRNDLFE